MWLCFCVKQKESWIGFCFFIGKQIFNRFRFLFCDLTSGNGSRTTNKCSFVYLCVYAGEKERKKSYVQLNWRVEQLSERTLTHHCKGGIVSAFSFVGRCLPNGSILKTCCFSNLLYVLVMSEPVCLNDCSVEVPLCYCLANLWTELILASIHLPPFQLK